MSFSAAGITARGWIVATRRLKTLHKSCREQMQQPSTN
jgi:hypothetical protein